MSRIQTIKANRTQEKQIITALKKNVNDIVALCGLDADKVARRMQVALKSEYGRVNGLINLLAAICKWPAEAGDGASVSANQMLIEEKLSIDLLLLEDISTFKGFHTFHTDELEVIAGIAPQYDDYRDYSTIFLEDLGFDRAAATICETKWENTEKAAKRTTTKSVAELQTAVAEHKKLTTPDTSA